jgi:hypothetical protein
MMSDVAHQVTGDHTWSMLAVGLILAYCLVSAWLTYRYVIGGNLRELSHRLRDRAALCVKRTGYVGALIARHTVLVTLNVLVLNLGLNLLSAIRPMDDHSIAYSVLTTGLEFMAAVCVGLVALIAAITFTLCNEAVRQAEDER